MVPRKSEEEARGSYIGLRRHHHLPAADVCCQIYILLHTFVYVSHAIVNILYFTSTLPSRKPTQHFVFPDSDGKNKKQPSFIEAKSDIERLGLQQ